jgi:antitoxin VapB
MDRRVSLFRNGRNQAVRIPRDLELPGMQALLRREGDRLIIEPIAKSSLESVVRSLPVLDEDELLGPIDELPLDPVEL